MSADSGFRWLDLCPVGIRTVSGAREAEGVIFKEAAKAALTVHCFQRGQYVFISLLQKLRPSCSARDSKGRGGGLPD